MFKIILKSLLFFFCFSLYIFTQAQGFNSIDAHAKNASKSAQKTVETLANYLNEGATSDLEKVRAYYVWLTHNIVYDTKTFFSNNPNPKTSAADALKYKRAICQGYSELFKALCDYSNIPCVLISGYSKGYGYSPNKKITNADHAWNVVFVENKWQLIDATWGGGYVDGSKKYTMKFSEEFFLPKPEAFLLKHLPADPMWQLISCPISITDYKKKDEAINALVTNCSGSFNFNDTIAAYQKLSPINQQIESADRAYRFNPDNVEAPGYALLGLSFDMGNELKQMYDAKDYKEALRLNKEILAINKKAYRFLRRSKNPHSKNAAEICKQNIESSEGNIKSLEKFLK
ncbi:MAG: hypothetical protein PF517_20955 [Salinivirgaceae bacterium]|jgi:hypothetical protein|nr:hypothetical protein [Salinivirgaceae bacterium]